MEVFSITVEAGRQALPEVGGGEMEIIKVLVVDEHPLAREGVRALLQTDSEIRVVGQAQDGQEAIAKVLEYQPDIVLMDLQLPKIDGLPKPPATLNLTGLKSRSSC